MVRYPSHTHTHISWYFPLFTERFVYFILCCFVVMLPFRKKYIILQISYESKFSHICRNVVAIFLLL